MPNGDALPFEVKVSGAPVGQGKDIAVIKIEIENAPVLKLANSEQVQEQNKIVAMGYPGINPDILYQFNVKTNLTKWYRQSNGIKLDTDKILQWY